MTIALKVMELSGSDLGRVPESERVLLIQLGHLHNTINFLYRWLLSSHIKGKSGADLHAALAQHNLAARTLALPIPRKTFGASVIRHPPRLPSLGVRILHT